jgi:YbbR domain-containing protein
VPIKENALQLPLGVVMSGINPSVVRVNIEKKVRKSLQVKVMTKGQLPEGKRLRKIRVEPSQITVEGPENALAHVDVVSTEELDLADVTHSMAMEKSLIPLAPQVRFLNNDPVRVYLSVSGR